jgi:hypothetical protein
VADNRHVGRVVKITRFPIPGQGLGNQLRKGEVAWAIVSHRDAKLRPGELNVDLIIYPATMEQEIIDYGRADWTLDPNTDEWELVRHRDVPGEVWAALAKWKLSQ